MLDVLRRERPADAVVGEEVGPQPGNAARRWILDGIDGTHNFSLGRPGWATAIALEVDGEIVVGVLSAPALGRRWWAVRGEGRGQRAFPPAPLSMLRPPSRSTSAGRHRWRRRVVIVIPWRDSSSVGETRSTRRFPMPTSPRSQCFVLDAVMVAAGELDAAILTFGSLWDFAGPSLIVGEAGGVFRDAWGGERFDTHSGVFTNPALIDDVLVGARRVATART